MSTKPLRLIGLTGLAGTGKDTVREMLERDHGFTGLAFADPIRQMIRTLLAENGFDPEYMDDRALKELPIPALGVSYRNLAQTLGTEWGRKCMGRRFWLQIAHAFIIEQRRQGGREFVVSDVRFANEAEWIKEAGGEVWRIERRAAAPVRDHESERHVVAIEADRVIVNNGTVEDLWCQVSALVGGEVAA
jgi:hypothetical protein